jgi:hypothetical protein
VLNEKAIRNELPLPEINNIKVPLGRCRMHRYYFRLGTTVMELEPIEEDLPDDHEAVVAARLAAADIMRDAALARRKRDEFWR